MLLLLLLAVVVVVAVVVAVAAVVVAVVAGVVDDSFSGDSTGCSVGSGNNGHDGADKAMHVAAMLLRCFIAVLIRSMLSCS